jgi:chromosomal replication initiator protein
MSGKAELFLSKLKNEINPTDYNIWFEPSVFDFSKLNDKIIIIICSASYIRENIKTRFINTLKNIWFDLFQEKIWFDFRIDKSMTNKLELESKNAIQPDKTDVDDNIGYFKTNDLNDRYTFKNFVVGDSNQFARAAAWAVATNPGKQFNPLFIYGGPGLGKTHLMQAIGHYVVQNQPGLKVLYITSEEFTNKFINALTQKKTHIFREKFLQIDILLIDDIQFLKDKEQTQEVFFHTFNSLHNSGKQVVISSDKSPKELASFEDRLRNRMEWGLQADIQPPRYETRLAILRQLNETMEAEFNQDILEYIAENFKSDVREIEGAFNKVFAFKQAYKEMDLNLCKNLFKDIIEDENKIVQNVPMTLIIKEVGRTLNVDLEQILSNKRDQPIAYARQVSMYLCKEITDHPYQYIGKEFGKDHSTVIHAYKKIQNLINEDNNLLKTINEIKKTILKIIK